MPSSIAPASPFSRTTSHLDFAWLDRLYSDLGSSSEFMLMLAGDYREAGESFVSAVNAGQGPEVLVDLAHSLAGASGLLGVRLVLDLAQSVELAPNSLSISALIDALVPVMDTLDEWVSSLA